MLYGVSINLFRFWIAIAVAGGVGTIMLQALGPPAPIVASNPGPVSTAPTPVSNARIRPAPVHPTYGALTWPGYGDPAPSDVQTILPSVPVDHHDQLATAPNATEGTKAARLTTRSVRAAPAGQQSANHLAQLLPQANQ
jgi:hypothetical protein